MAQNHEQCFVAMPFLQYADAGFSVWVHGDGNGGKSKRLKMGVREASAAPGGIRGQRPGGGQGAKPLEAEGFF